MMLYLIVAAVIFLSASVFCYKVGGLTLFNAVISGIVAAAISLLVVSGWSSCISQVFGGGL